MNATITIARNYVNRYRHHRQDDTYAGIVIANGMRMNGIFFWYCVDHGILDMDS